MSDKVIKESWENCTVIVIPHDISDLRYSIIDGVSTIIKDEIAILETYREANQKRMDGANHIPCPPS